MTANAQAAAAGPMLAATLGAACISCSAILVTLAGTAAATTAFFRCVLALPVLAVLALIEQRRHGRRAARARLGAVVAGLLLAVDLVLWNHAIAEVGAGIATVLGNLQVAVRRRGRLAAVRRAAQPPVPGHAARGDGGRGAGLRPGRRRRLRPSTRWPGSSTASARPSPTPAFLLIFRQSSTGTEHVAGPLADATAGAALGALRARPGCSAASPCTSAWSAFGWLLLLATSSQTIGWLLITSSLPRLPAAVSSLLLLLQPAASLLLVAAVVLGQRPTLLQVAGAVLVCGGVLAASGALPLRRGAAAAGARRPGRGDRAAGDRAQGRAARWRPRPRPSPRRPSASPPPWPRPARC